MATQFPPSTFPTMSLGAPANLSTSPDNRVTPAPPPPADPSSVLSAIRCCSSHEAAVRGPAEGQLQQWENASSSGMHATGYLTSLVSVVESSNESGGGSDNDRLLGAILLKNGIPKAFGVPLPESPDAEVDASTLARLQQERAHVRSQLPTLLFREGSAICAVHLQLALSNVALFDFPAQWPTLLEDLASVASGQQQPDGADPSTVRLRAIKTLRLCLQAIRQRRILIQKPKGVGRNPLLLMNNLGSLIGKAAQERKELHGRACAVFLPLAEGIVKHAQAAVGGGGGDARGWRAECSLAVGYVKCMTELVPMVEIDDVDADPRTPAVRQLLQSLAQIIDAAKAYPSAAVPPTLASIPSVREEYTTTMDKLYRATLVCCCAAIRSLAQLFAAQVPGVLPAVVEPILVLDAPALHSLPVKRLMCMTSVIHMITTSALYDEKRKDSFGGAKNAVLAALMGKGAGGGAGANASNPHDDLGVVEAQKTVTALLAEGTIEQVVEALVGKFLRLHPDEIAEWEHDPEGRYETDLAQNSLFQAESPRHCGGALLLTLMNRETDRVAATLLALTQRVFQQDAEDVNGMLNREACYRAVELCHSAMVGRGQRRLNFSEWYQAELRPILQTDLEGNSPVAMRAMQARAVQVVQAYSTSLKPEEFGLAFQSIARLMIALDLVTAFCAARCISQLALIHVKGTEESVHLLSVREHSVVALGNAFSLAKRSESEECLRVTLMCVSALVEANGLYLEPVLQAIAEQLPLLWERARDSVPILSSLLSVLTHLIMKMGCSTVENLHVQTVLFPLLDYCTDISVVNRADTLLEDGLRLWLVTVVSSRLSTMGQKLTNMLPRLEAILSAGLEPHVSLKVLQFNAVLLGQQVVEPLAAVLRDMLVNLTSCIHSNQKGEDDDAMDGDFDGSKGTDRSTTTMKYAAAALRFAESMCQLFPNDLGLSICAPAMSKVIAALPGAVRQNKAISPPLLDAIFDCFGRMLWLSPNCLDEIFANGPDADTVAIVLEQYISSVKSVHMIVMLNAQAQKMVFIKQKGAALSLCSAVCRSPRVARTKGQEVLSFTQALLKIESKSPELLDLNALVEAACGTTRKVVGDGPLGDSAARTADILKSDPLLTVSLREASENAEKAVASL